MAQSSSLGGPRPGVLLQGGGVPFKLSPFEMITLLLVCALTAFIGYTVYARATDLNATPATPSTYLPTFRRTLESTVSASGTVASTQQVSLTFDVGTAAGDRKIQQMFVRLGDHVQAGQPLAKIDDSQLAASLRAAEANLASAEARFSASIQPPKPDAIASAEQSIISARAGVINAQKNVDDLNLKPTPQETATAQQKVITAQSALQTAQDNAYKAQNDVITAGLDLNTALNNITSACSVSNNNLVSAPLNSTPTPGSNSNNSNSNSSGFDASRCAAAQATAVKAQQAAATAANNSQSGNTTRAIENARLGLQAANEDYAKVVAGPTRSERDAAQASLDAAKASLVSAEARYTQMFQTATPDVTLPLQAAIESAKEQVATAKKLLDAATIVAPFEGDIGQVGSNVASGGSIDVGSTVQSNTVVFVLVNRNTLRIDAAVDQANISNLDRGQVANVTFDALTGRSYQATISAIGRSPTITQGVVTYVVTMAMDVTRLPQGTPVPTPGMTASLTIQTARTENALVVPARALRRVGGRQTVTVKTANGDEVRNVTTGATNGTLTQVLTGVNEGDEVLVSAAATAARTGATQTNPFAGPGPGR